MIYTKFKSLHQVQVAGSEKEMLLSIAQLGDAVAGPLVYVLDIIDRIIYKVCPFIAGGIRVGSVYWTAVTYGAVTVMQVTIT